MKIILPVLLTYIILFMFGLTNIKQMKHTLKSNPETITVTSQTEIDFSTIIGDFVGDFIALINVTSGSIYFDTTGEIDLENSSVLTAPNREMIQIKSGRNLHIASNGIGTHIFRVSVIK